MKLTADNITNKQLRDVLMLDDPEDAFEVAILATTGTTFTMPPVKATDEQQMAARARCAEILNARAEVNVMDGGTAWPPDDRTPSQVEADEKRSKS